MPPAPLSLLQRLERQPVLRVRRGTEQLEDPRDAVRTFVDALQAVRFAPGERLGVMLPNGPGFVTALLACLELRGTFVPFPTGLEGAEQRRRLELAQVQVTLEDGVRVTRISTRTTADLGPSVVLFTSGSTAGARAVVLSERALLHVVDTHRPVLGEGSAGQVLGFLSWTHAFGFTLELLLGLLDGATLTTVAPAHFPQRLEEDPPDRIFTVPRMIERIAPAVLQRLGAGGVIGGAPVRGAVRMRVMRTQLRVGYGQTELAPGITLGGAGEWPCDDFLGFPVGCELELRPEHDEHALYVRGASLGLGYLDGPRLTPLVGDDGWRATDDLVQALEGGGLVFRGRRDERFKLDNGRMLNPTPYEVLYDGRVLLVPTKDGVQPLTRGPPPERFTLPFPHLPPREMPEPFWTASTTATGKISRRLAQRLFESA